MAGKRVLVVDADITHSEMLKNRLEAKKYLVDCARSGVEALTILEREWVDLIVLSVILQEGMHGFWLLKEIKKNNRFSKIPVIIQSAKPGMRKSFENIGVEDFFVKPYSIRVFLDVVNTILTKNRGK